MCRRFPRKTGAADPRHTILSDTKTAGPRLRSGRYWNDALRGQPLRVLCFFRSTTTLSEPPPPSNLLRSGNVSIPPPPAMAGFCFTVSAAWEPVVRTVSFVRVFACSLSVSGSSLSCRRGRPSGSSLPWRAAPPGARAPSSPSKASRRVPRSSGRPSPASPTPYERRLTLLNPVSPFGATPQQAGLRPGVPRPGAP